MLAEGGCRYPSRTHTSPSLSLLGVGGSTCQGSTIMSSLVCSASLSSHSVSDAVSESAHGRGAFTMTARRFSSSCCFSRVPSMCCMAWRGGREERHVR
ncbi:hypothetical protein FKM82_031107 [Ascaphus truei]